MTNTKPLHGRIALVTGASRSLGKDIALRLAEAGASIIGTYRSNQEAARATAGEIEAHGVKVAMLRVDLEGTGDLDRFVGELDRVLEQWDRGQLDILVNNAGISCHNGFDQLTEADLDAQYATNYKSVVFLSQRLAPRIADGGRIINVSSGLTRFTIPHLIGYAPFKAAIETFTRYLAKLLGGRGVTVNVVAPGALATDFNRAAFEHNPQMVDLIAANTTLGRVGRADDIGGVVAFLCSADAGWITGVRLEASGGMFL